MEKTEMLSDMVGMPPLQTAKEEGKPAAGGMSAHQL